MKKLVVIASCVGALFLMSFDARADLSMTFVPSAPEFVDAANEYTELWSTEGARIIESMERISEVRFTETAVKAIIYEGISKSGRGAIPMRLRASYSPDTKKATLIHELGHRLLQEIPNTYEVSEHKKLFLMLYDVWVDLYGMRFANEQVEVERKRKGVYPEAWDWALSLTKSERRAKLAELRARKSIEL